MDSPAEHLRELLAACRRREEPFAGAWPVALTAALAVASAVERDEWRDALEDTREQWRGGYERREPSRAERSLVAVAYDPERERSPSGRWCERCNAPIPVGRQRSARYCCRACQRAGTPIAA